ncbi:MAG: HTH domain-containing protein [Bacteroidales bacterium]
MQFVKINAYIDQLDTLIKNECTGPANEFAQKLGVSERTLQNHLQQLRDIGIEVVYDYYKKTYRYAQRGRLKFGFAPEELSKIKGGLSIPYSKACYKTYFW